MNLDELLKRVATAIIIAVSTILSGSAQETRPPHPNPTAPVRVIVNPSLLPAPKPERGDWKKDPEVSWYGPGFYGKRTACGQAYTKTILGVAHRSLPCGTLIVFRWQGKTATVPVIDRGPYVEGRTWDLSGGLCVYLKHCFTGPIEWRFK